MSRTERRRLPRSLFQGIAVGVIGAVLVGAAVIAAGFDVKQTPVNDASIWALQSGDGNRYARVNTEIGELDTIKTVRNPSALAQNAAHTLLLAQNNERLADIDAVRPVDFDAANTDYEHTPTGTVQVVSAADTIAYRTNTGSIFVARISDGAASSPLAVDPYAADPLTDGAERRFYRSDAIALGEDGTLLSYSSAEQSVLRYSVPDAAVAGFDPVPDGPTEGTPQLSQVADSWALLAEDGDSLWLRDREGAIDPGVSAQFVVQSPSSAGRLLYIADDAGLSSIDVRTATVERVLGDTSGAVGARLGVPAKPLVFDGIAWAAWLPSGTAQGTLWSSDSAARALDFGARTLSEDAQPVFQSNGARLILNDTQSGWVWTLPDGALVPSSQDWGVLSAEQEQTSTDEQQTAEVLEPKPPVAEPDSFGVRAGALAVLPVLLNDHDPNTDVLTVMPSSLTALPPEFGTLSLTDQSQSIAVRVAPDATGSATFSYAVTDGTRADGLNSEPTTVTLTVHDELSNSAPVWCGTEGCLARWPSPELAPGGTVTVPVLPGWVDPDGDPLFVSAALNQSGIGSVGTTQAGEVVYRHPNPALDEPLTVAILVTVSDTRGATSERVLSILVTPSPRLTATPFALSTAVGESLTVDPDSFVDGVTGSYRIVSATAPPTAQGAVVTVNSGASTFDFTAANPGEYVVRFSLADAVAEVQSFVRVTVVAQDAASLSTTPVTVFVRPRADATVDVFSAVSNPAGRVLLVSEPLPRPVPGAALEVSLVGQNLLRMRGTTADEQPGLLGVVGYTVSDGTGDPRFRTEGEASVYLLPAPTPQPPIAAADSIVVRAGTQIDIPVLKNDLAPDGNRMVLNPDSIVNQSGEGLAFAAGSILRYLAPDVPGEYELRYTISTSGAPELTDTAAVTVTVTPDGENQKPVPRTLTGRVLSGETVRIPFDSFGIDPDGDEVLLDRVLTQPASGSASISATGDSIVYTSVKGFRGPVQFDYRVRDAQGDTGSATVRIGVLDAQSDPSPITFSDYVQVQAGQANQVVLHPAANDIDPTGGVLSLNGVLPDAVQGSQEYSDLQTHILSVNGDDPNAVVLKAGTEPGTMAFTYTVENSRGDIGVGLIVMTVVRASIPDHPVIVDTVLTLDERAAFAQGIDVVSGKVSWTAGDVSGLTLSIWGDPHGVQASGWKLRGTAPDAGLLLPFALTGTSFAGDVVTSYGFLRIPAVHEAILALKPGLAPLKVKEAEALRFDMATLVGVPSGEVLEIGRGSVEASGQRPGGTCVAESGSRIRYDAGEGQPWTDSCVVPVRLAGSDAYTHLAVPIEVTPRDPQPELRPAAVTASPGAAAVSYDLQQMVHWQGKPDPASLVFVVEHANDQFVVTQEGSRLSVQALDSAVPGRETPVTVRLSSYPDTPPAVLALRVGPAPSALPKGGTVAQECSQAAGSSCLIPVIGAPGEANAFANTPLTLVSVSVVSSCAGVSFAVDGTSQVRASWANDSPGGVCQATFVVADAQGKRSAAERNGSVTLDLQGFPRAPDAISQVAYDSGSITLAITPGPATTAHPTLQGFVVLRDGVEVASCTPAGVCPTLTGMKNGDKALYEARSINAAGRSLASVSTTAWAYAVPGMGEATAEPVFDATRTTLVQGVAEVSIPNSDPSTQAYLVNGTRFPVSTAGSGATTFRLALPVGPNTVVIQPLSSIERPSGTGPADKQGSVGVSIAGLPSVNAGGQLSASERTITAPEATGVANNSTRTPVTLYIATPAPATAACRVDANGRNLTVSGNGSVSSTSSTISGLTPFTTYNVEVCHSNGFGYAQLGLGSAYTWAQPDAPSGFTYTVSGTNGQFTIDKPTSTATTPAGHEVVFSGYPSDRWGQDPQISVRYCVVGSTERCSQPTPVTAANPNKAWQVRLDAVTLAACIPGKTLTFGVSGKGTENSAAAVTATGYEYLVPGRPAVPGSPGSPAIPAVPDSIDPDTGLPIPGTGSPEVPAVPAVPAVPGTADEWKAAPTDGILPSDATKVRSIAWALAWGAPQMQGFAPLAGVINQEFSCG
ncbi:Ig-like domain-containing protein [Microterricola viridarii]|uniref:Fibronectin type-III domain-containing protein n=1 Tax=Microterricola viridarii TaxID=412690 RepID=A0A0Y0MC13_9MICO|nr:Ig-like domain-containing protein [Microterricola viridarii]AMB57646.1 hypothetical protein AWU67_00855 [Microterricola viridarii]